MFRKKKSEASRKNWFYCSISCATTNKNHNKQKKYIDKKCKYCEKIKTYRDLIRNRNRIFCSVYCSLMFRNKFNNPLKNPIIAKKISKLKTGVKIKKHSIESRIRQSKRYSGNKSHFWKGGVSKVNLKIRSSVKYSIWRTSVFERDNYTCQKCFDNNGGNLNAHHIKPFSEYKNLRFCIDNGITLCKECHKKIHKKIINL